MDLGIKDTITTYKGLGGICTKLLPFPDRQDMGRCITVPQVGTRFLCGTVSTNIVAKILEQTEESVKFETLSGSIYFFEIKEKGEISKEIKMPENEHIVEALTEYLKDSDEDISND